MNSSRRPCAFTLVEVIVALGIAGGALILLVSASRASLTRSLRSQQSVQIEQLMENKLNEVRAGVEASNSGTFENAPEWSWRVERSPADVGELTKLENVTVILSRFDGAVRRASVLQFNEKKSAP